MSWTEAAIAHIVKVRKLQGRSVLSLVKEFPDGAPARSTVSELEKGKIKSMTVAHLQWWGKALSIDWIKFFADLEQGKTTEPPMPKTLTINGVVYKRTADG